MKKEDERGDGQGGLILTYDLRNDPKPLDTTMIHENNAKKANSRISSVTFRNRRIWSTAVRDGARRSSCRNCFACTPDRGLRGSTTTVSVVYYLVCWTFVTWPPVDTICRDPWKARPV